MIKCHAQTLLMCLNEHNAFAYHLSTFLSQIIITILSSEMLDSQDWQISYSIKSIVTEKIVMMVHFTTL